MIIFCETFSKVEAHSKMWLFRFLYKNFKWTKTTFWVPINAFYFIQNQNKYGGYTISLILSVIIFLLFFIFIYTFHHVSSRFHTLHIPQTRLHLLGDLRLWRTFLKSLTSTRSCFLALRMDTLEIPHACIVINRYIWSYKIDKH